MSLAKMLFLVFALLIPIDELAAAETVPTLQFHTTMREVDLSPYIEILSDPDHSLTIDDIVTGGEGDKFKPISTIGDNAGFTKFVYWVRFSLDVDTSLRNSLLLELECPLIDNVILFVPDGQGGFSQRTTGDALLFSTRDVQYRTFLFRLPEHRGETRNYYMRLQTEGSMQIPLSLWTASAFIEHVDRSNFLLGGYYGVMLLLMLAALASFFKLRDRLFLFYALYLLSYLLLQISLNGFSYQWLWPTLPWLTSRITAAFIGLVVAAGCLFAGSFLQIWEKRHPRVKLLFYTLIACGLVSAVMSLFGNYALAVHISVIFGLCLPPVVLIGIISSLAIGYRPARYFFVAWCVFLFGVFISGLLYLGLVPHTFLTLNAMQIGSTFEILLLGYALMDRINLLRVEKEKATEQASAYLQQLNEELEVLVGERTLKLEEQNKKLNELAVQDSMTSLLNHKASIDYLRLMQSSAERYNHHLAVIMLDIDQFKTINDRYGHPAGDKVVCAVAGVLKETVRESDGCGRYGGDEFILILPESDSRSAWDLAERTRKNIKKLRVPEIGNTSFSASFGVAVFDPFHPDANLITLADRALYKAKETGRDRVVLAEASSG